MPVATIPAHEAAAQATAVPASDATLPVEEHAADSNSEFGMLDEVETTRIRQVVTTTISFLSSKGLLPTVLMRVGPLRVLLPIVWGVYSLRSKKWLAGTSFICMGLLSFVLAFDPALLAEMVTTGDDADAVAVDDEETPVADASSDFGSPQQTEFSIPARTDSTATKPATPNRDSRTAATRETSKPTKQTSTLGAAGAVWLVGTIEDADEADNERTAERETISRAQR